MNYFQKITAFSGLLDAQIVHHLNVHKKVNLNPGSYAENLRKSLTREKRKRQVKTGEVNESVSSEKLVMENEQELSVSNKLLAITNGEEINKRRLTY